MNIRRRAFSGLLFLLPLSSQAGTLRTRPFFQSSRALAMGDAFTAYNVGFEAVYYNPAGVARRNPLQLKYIDFELSGSQAMYSFFKQSVSSVGALAKIADNIAANPGKVHSMALAFTPQMIARNFSIGIVAKSYSEGLVNSETRDLDFYGYTDLALYMQYGVAFAGGVVKLGVGLKVLDRAELERTYSQAEYGSTKLDFASQWQEGIGYGVDAGLMITAPIENLPTFGLAVQDIGDTKLSDRRVIFTGASGRAGAPPPLKQRINAGYAMTFKHAPGVKSGMSFEMKDLAHISDNYLERFHAGWELNVKKAVMLRLGVNEGKYWTAGFGLQLADAALELATYGENLLIYSGQTRNDRKFVGRYVLSF